MPLFNHGFLVIQTRRPDRFFFGHLEIAEWMMHNGINIEKATFPHPAGASPLGSVYQNKHQTETLEERFMNWNKCREYQDELVRMRRDLHRIPELGLHLPKTRAYVIGRLEELEIPYTLSHLDSSILAVISGGQPGKTVALRADMDALPIQEETDADYASCHEGLMHACGHDAHTAMLLGAAKILKARQSQLRGTVLLVFQAAEEGARGAKALLARDALAGVDGIFGIHIGSILSKDIPAGTLIASPGCCMASCDRFVVRVSGVGCHGSTPEKGVDPINIAAHIILALQAVNSREFNACVPVVLTVGSIHGGQQYNIIPTEVVIEGTIRTLDAQVRQQVARRIGEISAATAAAFGGSARLEMDWGAGPVVNDPDMAALAADAAREVLGPHWVVTRVEHPNMGGEDFACYLEKIPGAFLFLSSANPQKHTDIAHHHPRFNIDEDVLWMGAAVYAATAEKFLKG